MKLKLFLVSIPILLSLVAYQKYSEYSALKSIDSYESCISAKGSRIQESYPATCVTKLGIRFNQPISSTKVIGNSKNYTNYLEGISITFPITGVSCDAKPDSVGNIVTIFYDPTSPTSSQCPVNQESVDSPITINIRRKPYFITDPLQLFSNHIDLRYYRKNITKQNIGGIEGNTLVFKFGPLNQVSYIIKNNSAYEFFIQARDGNEKNNLELANQILSTFKFTN